MSRRIKRPDRYWHMHAHSHYSVNDAVSPVEELVKAASNNHQPALALTDHGNMGGTVRLYKACRKAGIAPFPGIEVYVKHDATDKAAGRHHLCLAAFTTEGYQALVRLTSHSHTRGRFHHKPHVDFSDFAEWAERGWTDGIAATTGCYFGLVQQALVHEGFERAKWLTQTLASWFPHLYVELQHHGIDHGGFHDDDLVIHTAKIADEIGLPCVITQDAHYARAEEKPYHETLKRLVAFGDDADDAVFPGDSFHLADGQWVRSHYPELLWHKGLAGLTDLYHKHTLQIPELEEYHYRVPKVSVDPDEELREAIADDMAAGFPPEYEDRLHQELDVLDATGMAAYLMLCKEVADWCHEHGVFFLTRGSASGSLVCYLLGITQLDPVRWGLRHERFLSTDRTKPPDVDFDVEDTRREELLAWLRSRFSVRQIGTYGTYGVYATGTNAGRGSLLVSFVSRARKQGEDVSHIETVYDLDPGIRSQLFGLAERGAKKNTGVHAAGLVVTTTDEELERLVPTMLVPSSETTVTQFEGDDVEDLGLVKLDVLGLDTLTALRRCVELVGYSIHEPLDWIPMSDRETFKMLRRGDTSGVFQLKGKAVQKGCREMKVKSVLDLVTCLALYRPATMSNGVKDDYIDRRAGWASPPTRHEILESNLSETYGLPVFQEQVVSILRDLGFTPAELTDFLKAIKASNKGVTEAGRTIDRYKEKYEDLARQAGWSDADVGFAWNAFVGFSEYSFNKAHSTGYALTAYRLAYLKTHHPLEFAAALLETSAGTNKEKEYIACAREMGVRLLAADVNISGQSWTLDRGKQAVRKGLVSIKGVGSKAAREIAAKAPFDSITDLIDRCDAKAVSGGKHYHRDGSLSGVLAKLHEAGALKSLGLRPR